MKMVRQHFTVTIEVPAVSGDGWSKYPDYSLGASARRLRRMLYDAGETATVEPMPPFVEPMEDRYEHHCINRPSSGAR